MSETNTNCPPERCGIALVEIAKNLRAEGQTSRAEWCEAAAARLAELEGVVDAAKKWADAQSNYSLVAMQIEGEFEAWKAYDSARVKLVAAALAASAGRGKT